MILSDMKFPLDANVAGTVSIQLKESGHDIAEVINKDPRMLDKDILAWALKENIVSESLFSGLNSF